MNHTNFISNNYDKIDLMLNNIYFHNKKNGTFLQVGAYDGIGDSITYPFEKYLGWRGILVQPNKNLINSIKHHRSQQNFVLNVGIGKKDEILSFQILPSRLDSSSFVLNEQKKNKLRNIGYDGKSYKQIMQVLSYDSIIKISNLNKLDIAVIDVQGMQNDVLTQISSSNVKPTFVIAQFIHSNKSQLINIMHKNYDLLNEINKDLIFQRRYNIFIITRCCRINNLNKILDNLNKRFNGSRFNYNWLIACNQKFIKQTDVDQLNKILIPTDNRNSIVAKLFSPTRMFNFDSDLLNQAFFSKCFDDLDFVYILDDDNIIHENFLNVILKNIENDFDILTVNIHNYLGNIINLPVFCHTKIDTANMIFNYKYLNNNGGFICSLVGQPYIEDSLTFSRAIQNHAKIIYSQQLGAYYNFLR